MALEFERTIDNVTLMSKVISIPLLNSFDLAKLVIVPLSLLITQYLGVIRIPNNKITFSKLVILRVFTIKFKVESIWQGFIRATILCISIKKLIFH